MGNFEFRIFVAPKFIPGVRALIAKIAHIGVLLLVIISAVAMAGEKYAGKKILFVDSYHAGYRWSDGIATGIQETLKDTGVQLKRVEMDTKRNTSEAFKKAAAVSAKNSIQAFKPDVVIAGDDNASKYLIVPYFKDADLAFVFCGINWDASVYGFPYKNVTGIVETDFVAQVIRQLRKYARGDRIGFIGDDSLTTRKNGQYHQDSLNIQYDEMVFARTFEEWQKKYLELQDRVDLLLFINYAGIADWEEDKARRFIIENTKIPSGTNNIWTAPFSLLGIIKSPEEQGRWAARAALRILDGVPPDRIPISHNRQGKLLYNLRIGKKLGINHAPAGAIILE